MSPTYKTATATASPVSDAPCVRPVTGVKNMQAGSLPLYLRKQFYVACWNVRTLLDNGAQCITTRSLRDYGVDIACLSEVRIPDAGSRSIKVPGTESIYWLYHSGPTDNSGLHGVALALSTRAHNALIAWEPVSPRIISARFKGKPFNITVISVYAPTLSADNSVKEEYYEALQQVVSGVPNRDILIIAGDWNARTGPPDDNTRGIIGKFGMGQRCDNGERLVNFASYNNMVIANTRFQHRRKHLLTWYSNDGRTAHQLDYILIRSRWASTIQDCRSYRGAETGNANGTDHTLVRAKLKLRLTSHHKHHPRRKINVTPLEIPERCNSLSVAINSNLSNVSPSEASEANPEMLWSALKSSINKACEEELGPAIRKTKDWISADTLSLSDSAKTARLNGNPDFRRLRREASRSARLDQNRYWTRIAENMETATNVGDFGKLFQLIRRSSNRYCAPTPLLRDANGLLIHDLHGRMNRWVEHFSTLLNRPTTTDTPDEMSTSNGYNVDSGPPTREEITLAVKRLRNKKATGEDGIPSEVFKSCLSTLLDPIHALFEAIWETEVFPTDWGTCLLLPVFKKGDKTLCENYRGISLIDIAAKSFAATLLNRFSLAREERTRQNQGGFRRGRGCIDQIFTLRRILEHRYKYQQPTSACFVDFRAAFDSIDRNSLWKLIYADGMPGKLVNLLKSYYATTQSRVRMYGEESSPFSLTTGVRQGCPLSPVLFNYAVDWVMYHAIANHPGVQLSDDIWIADLEFADDIVILADNPSNLQPVLDRINHYAAAIGLQINATKTKFFTTSADPSPQLTIQGEEIELVSTFRYLGSTLLPNGQAKEEIPIRINKARFAFQQLKRSLWNRSEISLRTKLRVYRAAIRPVLMYGCETWPLRKEDIRRMEVFDHWCLRRILKVSWRDRISNEDVRHRCFDIQKLPTVIQRQRLKWFGHVIRRPSEELTRVALSPQPCNHWRCRPGGQLKTWITTIKADMDSINLQSVYGVRRWKHDWLKICTDLATERRAWQAMIRDINGADSSSRRS
ncbi:MAG: reverse transcriptase domain-containing protein [Candidatus Thiodiazotropha sp.]